MTPWIMLVLAVVVWLLWSLAMTYLHRRRLRGLFAGRDPEAARAATIARFPQVDATRAEAAYRWVQRLADHVDAPIRADDRLQEDLGIDPDDVDGEFEAAHEWAGERPVTDDVPEIEPVRTVYDLMASVLRYGYEGYAAVE